MLRNGTRISVTAVIVAAVTAISIVIAAPAGSTATSFPEANWVSPGWCLGITNDAATGQAIQWQCNGEADQGWHWGSETGFTGYYQLINGTGNCLSLSGGNSTVGTPVVAAQCIGRADQYWRTAAECVLSTSHGPVDYWPLFSYAASGKGLFVVGPLGSSNKEGASLVLEGYLASCDDQFWSGPADPLA